MKYAFARGVRYGFVGYRDNFRCLIGFHSFDNWRQVFGPWLVSENRCCKRCCRTEWREAA
jgi:hypothetical protein